MLEKDIFGKMFLEPEVDDLLNCKVVGDTHIAEDWPYGRQKRCMMKFWVETSKKNQQRLVKQSVFQGRENKPKKTTFAHRVVIIEIDGKIGHVEWSKSMNMVAVRMQAGQYKESTFFDSDAAKLVKHFFSE